MSAKSLCSIFLLLIAGPLSLSAQQFPFRRLTVEDGVGHSIVYRAYQTKDGYLWFSTDNGLTRYDGANFKNFTSAEGLKSAFIFDVLEWRNQLYVCTFGGGLMKFVNNFFVPAPGAAEGPTHPINMYVYRDQLWILDRSKDIQRYDGEKFYPFSRKHLPFDQNDHHDMADITHIDSVLYIATDRGLFSVTGDTTVSSITSFRNQNVLKIESLANKNLLVIATGELVEFDPTSGVKTVLYRDINFSRHSVIKEDSHGNIWMGLVNGKVLLLEKTPSGRKVTGVADQTVVNQIFEDREKNIWISTYGEGLIQIQSTYIRNYPIKGAIVADLAVDPVSKHAIVVSVNAGLKRFVPDEQHHLKETTDLHFNRFPRDRMMMTSTYFLPDGTFFLSAEHYGYRWSKGHVDSIYTQNGIATFYHQSSRNRMWVGKRFGLGYTNMFLKDLQLVPEMRARVVRSISEDFDGNIIAGTDAGIFIQSAGGFKPMDAGDTLKTTINALYRDDVNRIMWAGTNEGIARIANGRLTFIENPLTRVRCNSIDGADAGRLWFGTINGLIFTEDGQNFEVITTKEGLPQANIIKVHYDDQSKILTLLTPNGLSVINADKFFASHKVVPPEIIFEDASSSGKKIDLSKENIVLSPDMRQLTLLVSTPLVKNRDKMRYQYKINDRNWTDFNGREISLQSLPYGNLTMTVRALKLFNEGEFTERSLSLTVVRPFFLRWWFFTIIGVGAALFIVLVVVSYSKRKTLKLLEENKRLDVEHKALRNLLNPHFLYNAINSIQAFILQNDQRKTLAYLSKFSQLVRLNLELLSRDHVTLEKEIKNIGLYLEFEKLRFAEKLNYTIDIDPAITQSEITIPSFIIQPFLENAIWHGVLPREQGGSIQLRVRSEEDTIVVLIEDDGIGINTSLKQPKADIEKKTSMGIKILRERVDLLKKVNPVYDLTIFDKADLNGKATGTGTVVRITLPVALAEVMQD